METIRFRLWIRKSPISSPTGKSRMNEMHSTVLYHSWSRGKTEPGRVAPVVLKARKADLRSDRADTARL